MVGRINVTLSEEVAEELDRLSKEIGIKKSKLIEKALIFYLNHLDLKIVEERLKKLESGETYTIPAEKVYEELGLV